jgi:hypothetical protein
MANTFEVVRTMQIAPITKDAILRLLAATLAPIVPLALTMMPLEELLKMLFRHVVLCTPILALRQRRRLRQPLPEALREGGVVFVGRLRAFVHARELFQVGKRFRCIDAAEFVEIIG